MKITNYCDPSTITNLPHIMELSDDFVINTKLYNRYNLKNTELGFFIFKENITNDCKYIALNNICMNVNDYNINRIIRDSQDASICYVLYRKGATDYIAKIQKTSDREYETQKVLQISTVTAEPLKANYYYTRRHFELIAQTADYVIAYDNFCIRRIKKDLSTWDFYLLREPVLIKKQSGNDIYFVDIDYKRECIYNVEINSLSRDWYTIEPKETNFCYQFPNTDVFIPVIDNAYFMKAFIIYNNVKRDDYDTTYFYATGDHGTVWYANIARNASYRYKGNNDIGLFWGGRGTCISHLAYNDGNTYNWGNGEWASGSPAEFPGKFIKHDILDQQITFYNKDHSKQYLLSTNDSEGFHRFYIDEFDNKLLIVHNANNIGNLILLDNEMNVLTEQTFGQAILIGNKYDKNHFCIIFANNQFMMYEIENNNINEIYSKGNIKSFSITNNNIWLLNETRFDILTRGSISEFIVNFEKEEYDYTDTNINSYVKIAAKNFLKQYASIDVELTLSGPCMFENETDTISTKTTEGTKTIPIIITGSGKCSCEIKEVE